MIFSTHNLNCLNLFSLITIRLFLNHLFNLFSQKTNYHSSHNLSQKILPQHLLTYSLTPPLTKSTFCLHTNSHTIFPYLYQLPIHLPYTHTYTLFYTHIPSHTLFSTHTHFSTHTSLHIHSFLHTHPFTYSLTHSYTIQPFFPLHTYIIQLVLYTLFISTIHSLTTHLNHPFLLPPQEMEYSLNMLS
jgi:hypothetical protein